MTEDQSGAPPLQEQPRLPNKEELAKLFQQVLMQFGAAHASELDGTEVHPIQVIVQQKIEIEKLCALVDELLNVGAIDDQKLTMRLVARMASRIKELGKVRIATEVNGAIHRRRK